MQATKINTPEHLITWLTSKQVEDLLQISNVTRWKYTKAGILKGHYLGTILRYRLDEVQDAFMAKES